jgi:hypothetical protein
LGEGERGFDGEPEVADEGAVGGVEGGEGTEEELEGEEGDEEVEEEMPVSAEKCQRINSNYGESNAGVAPRQNANSGCHWGNGHIRFR